MTYSVMPDGTDLGGTPSRFHAWLRAQGIPEPAWREVLDHAMSQWAEAFGISYEAVEDSGAPLGFRGDDKSDARFGDIRIGAAPLGSTTLAIAFAPPPLNGSSIASDLIFNTEVLVSIDVDFSPRNLGDFDNDGIADFLALALHEKGHSFGVGHSPDEDCDQDHHKEDLDQSVPPKDQLAVMSAIYEGRVQELTEADLALVEKVKSNSETVLMMEWLGGTAIADTRRIEPGETIEYLVRVDSPSFYLLAAPEAESGVVVIRDSQQREGPIQQFGGDRIVYLSDGDHVIRLENRGHEPVTASWRLDAPAYMPSTMLPGGMGLGPAVMPRLVSVAPGGPAESEHLTELELESGEVSVVQPLGPIQNGEPGTATAGVLLALREPIGRPQGGLSTGRPTGRVMVSGGSPQADGMEVGSGRSAWLRDEFRLLTRRAPDVDQSDSRPSVLEIASSTQDARTGPWMMPDVPMVGQVRTPRMTNLPASSIDPLAMYREDLKDDEGYSVGPSTLLESRPIPVPSSVWGLAAVSIFSLGRRYWCRNRYRRGGLPVPEGDSAAAPDR